MVSFAYRLVSGEEQWVFSSILVLRKLLLRFGTSISEGQGAIMRASGASKPRFCQLGRRGKEQDKGGVGEGWGRGRDRMERGQNGMLERVIETDQSRKIK